MLLSRNTKKAGCDNQSKYQKITSRKQKGARSFSSIDHIILKTKIDNFLPN